LDPSIIYGWSPTHSGIVEFGEVAGIVVVELLYLVLMTTNPSVKICPSNVAPNTISKQA